MTVTAVDRHIDCAGVFNLRDLGGYPTTDGRSTRWRTLFRADGLHRVVATHRGVQGLAWRTVLDLRTLAERDAGSFACDGVDAIHLPVLRNTWDVDGLGGDIEDPTRFLTDRYLDMADSGAAAIAAVFDVLASPTRLPAVFHCAAGKDRTGVVAALVLAALGVDDDHIAADYHLSALAMDRLADWITTSRPETAEDMARQPQGFLACPPEAITLFLDELRTRHGAVEGYLRAIGVTTDTLVAVRHTLVESR